MDKFKVIETPDINETTEILRNGLKNKGVLIITACCKVAYEGRAKSTLESGDRVIIINKGKFDRFINNPPITIDFYIKSY